MGGNGMCATCNHARSEHHFDHDTIPCFHEEVTESFAAQVWKHCWCRNYVSESYVSATRSLRST